MSFPTNITTALQMASPTGKLRTFGLLASPEDWFKTDFVVGHDQISHHPNYDAHSSRWLSICSIESGDYLLGDRDANRLVFALEDSSLFKDFKGDVGKLQFAIVIELINVCRACEPEDTLLIMLYGHGDLNEGTGDVEERTAYLWLHGNVSDVKLQKSTLEDILKCSGHHAGQVYLSSSSCYSGAMVSGEWTNFTACAANETSDSRFTYHSRVSEEKSCLPFIPCPVARYYASRTEPPIRNLHLHLSLEALVSALHEGPELTSAPHANTTSMAIRYRMEKLSVDEKKELHKMLGGRHILREIFFAVAVNIGLYFDADSPEDLLMYQRRIQFGSADGSEKGWNQGAGAHGKGS
ncbi:hypothetical protein BT96DRAFT_1002404 [Gymnopus androsaceus JB14]|uniref:Uncharacterized protein n=1 Tax=Gymnopus androsaceus JB14 TaxID=1447944 RepID=A0A6A4GZ16_9AGAR|nr:hypothetical protein BT96DRAFT_1002404 [Gymnopus androsaceus JB14]